MSQEIQTYNPQGISPAPKASALNVMASRYSVEPAKLLDTLKQTVFKNATDAQLMALVVVANEYGLNPFTKQLYAFPDKGGGIVPVVGVDGWLKMMNDHPKFDGVEVDMIEDTATGKPFSCTATIHVKDRKFPTKVTEHLSECARNTDPWNKQPRRMLRHRAIIQAIRVAFGFSAMDPDEAEAVASATPANAGKPDFGPATVTSEPTATPKRLGRPPKTAAMPPAVVELPKVEPEQPQEGQSPFSGPETPETPPAPPTDAPAAKSQVNYLKGIRGMLKLGGIEEAVLLEFLRETRGLDDSLASLEEVAMMAPLQLEQAYNMWPIIEKAIKAVVK